jgi:hypothetical protein
MTLDEKRKIIEVLMCSSDVKSSGICVARLLFPDGETWSAAVSRRRTAEREIPDKLPYDYELSCVLAAYRLIETSSTLRREWFGAR